MEWKRVAQVIMMHTQEPFSVQTIHLLSFLMDCEPVEGRSLFIFVSLVFGPISSTWDKVAKCLLNEIMRVQMSTDFMQLLNCIIRTYTAQFCQLHPIIST